MESGPESSSPRRHDEREVFSHFINLLDGALISKRVTVFPVLRSE